MREVIYLDSVSAFVLPMLKTSGSPLFLII